MGPYEIARLAEALGTTTGEVVSNRLAEDGATLRTRSDGACTFLDGTRCSVHRGRPIACRLYPLGWATGPEGNDAFLERKPHPETEGIYGDDGTVAEYLEAQGSAPYERAARRYAAVLERVEAAAERDGPDPGRPPPLTDVDRAAEAECEARGIAIPEDVEARVDLHLAALHHWLDGAEAEVRGR